MSLADRCRTEPFPGAFYVELTAKGLGAVREGVMFREWPLTAPRRLYFLLHADADRHALMSGFGDGDYRIAKVSKHFKAPSGLDEAQMVMECFLGRSNADAV